MSLAIRACRPEETGALVALINRVFRPEGGDMESQYPLLFAPENRTGLRIALEDAIPVAHVGVCIREANVLGARVRVAGIGSVCTDPQQRGRGLASALMADARDYARECGASLMLISGGRGLYHRLGYVTVGRFDRYDLGPEHLPNTGWDVEVAPYRAADLTAVIALHQAEPVRFIRATADWRAVLNTGTLMNRPSELLMIRHCGHCIAYMAVQRPSRETKEGRGPAHIREFAGSRAATLAALPAMLAYFETDRASLVAQPSDAELAAHARSYGWNAIRQPFPGTLGVIDPPALLAAIRPLLDERAATASRLTITASADGATFGLDNERYEVAAPGPLAAVLFGGSTEEATATPACGGALGELLHTLFPLPLLWQGYNYV